MASLGRKPVGNSSSHTLGNSSPSIPVGWAKYTVTSKDTLSSIAIRYGMQITELKNANSLGLTRLYPGQILFVKVQGADTPESSAGHPSPPTTIHPSGTSARSVSSPIQINMKEKKEYYSLSPPKGYEEFIVQRKHTLSSVALEYNMRVTDLMEINRLKSARLFPGQIIYVPKKQPREEAKDTGEKELGQSASSPVMERDEKCEDEARRAASFPILSAIADSVGQRPSDPISVQPVSVEAETSEFINQTIRDSFSPPTTKKKKELPQPPPGYHYYVVNTTDTLMGLAIKFNMNKVEIMRINKLINSLLYPGQSLLIKDGADSKSISNDNKPLETLSQDVMTVVNTAIVEDTNTKQGEPPNNEDSENNSATNNQGKLNFNRTKTDPSVVLIEEDPTSTDIAASFDDEMFIKKAFSSKSNESESLDEGTTNNKARRKRTTSEMERANRRVLLEQQMQQSHDILKGDCRLLSTDGFSVGGVLTLTDSRLIFEPSSNDKRVKESGILVYQLDLPSHSLFHPQIQSLDMINHPNKLVPLNYYTAATETKFLQVSVLDTSLCSHTYTFALHESMIDKFLDRIQFYEGEEVKKQQEITHNKDREQEQKEEAGGRKEDEKEYTFAAFENDPANISIIADQLDEVLSVQSAILFRNDDLAMIRISLPKRAKLAKWELLYSTERHGISINTFYSRIKHTKHSIILIEDLKKNVFGAYCSDFWSTSNTGYYGQGECFIFSISQRKVYNWTGKNTYFMLSQPNAFAIGGGGGFGLWIDADLLEGTTHKCETFDNLPLTPTEDFTISILEVWGLPGVE